MAPSGSHPYLAESKGIGGGGGGGGFVTLFYPPRGGKSTKREKTPVETQDPRPDPGCGFLLKKKKK